MMIFLLRDEMASFHGQTGCQFLGVVRGLLLMDPDIGMKKTGIEWYPSWRIIPASNWLITMVSFCPLIGVVPLPNGIFLAYKWG